MGARAFLLARAPDALRQALRQLVAYRLRTGLALSGIAVGVAAVVGSTTLTDGVARNLRLSWERIGGPRVGILFSPAGAYSNGRWIAFPKVYPANADDRRVLLASLPELTNLCPSRWGETSVSTGRVRLGSVSSYAVGPDFLAVRPFDVRHGRFFTAGEDDGRERVAVVFDVLAEELFGRSDVIGETIVIEAQPFRIVGVLKRLWYGERNAYLRLYVPFRTGVSRLGRDPDRGATFVKLKAGTAWEEATPTILRLLVLRHPGSKPDNFRIRTFAEFQDGDLKAIGAQGDILALVSLICLFAGGVGILNVFLISVTERTREIGLRMALGASKGAILGQLLFEALFLCSVGGVAGLVAGQGVALGFAAATRQSMMNRGFVDPDSLSVALGGKGILLAVGLTLLTTALFGTYPAWRASRLDPAEALRHE